MISQLRLVHDDTATAVGPKFDLEKVLAAGRGVLLTLAGRSRMRFPDAPPDELDLGGGIPLDVSVDSLAHMESLYRAIRKDHFDTADLMVHASCGPYLVSWSPLGMSALVGSVGNCVTIYDEPWEDLDVTPRMLIHRRDAPFTPMGRLETKFLLGLLQARPPGMELDALPDGPCAETVSLAFPHDAFGAGTGRICICRYLDGNTEISFRALREAAR